MKSLTLIGYVLLSVGGPSRRTERSQSSARRCPRAIRPLGGARRGADRAARRSSPPGCCASPSAGSAGGRRSHSVLTDGRIGTSSSNGTSPIGYSRDTLGTKECRPHRRFVLGSRGYPRSNGSVRPCHSSSSRLLRGVVGRAFQIAAGSTRVRTTTHAALRRNDERRRDSRALSSVRAARVTT